MAALKAFEAAEANLIKLERLWKEVVELIPAGINFCENAEYEDRCREMNSVLDFLPKIDGWKPDARPHDLNWIAQARFDMSSYGDIESEVETEREILAPGQGLREYRFRFNQKRRELIRDALVSLIDAVDADIREIHNWRVQAELEDPVTATQWEHLQSCIDQIEVLLGSSVARPPRWTMLRRHLHFGLVCDFDDIKRVDWPAVKSVLRQGLYGENEPLPVGVEDLSELVAAKPRGAIITKLDWAALDAEGFERLLFALISSVPDYENPEWLMATNAPDRGRDLAVTRVLRDSLAGVLRQRVVVQCKHWTSRSVSLGDIATAKEQMALWGEPRVDVLVVATSGRFTTDAVQWTEKHNAGGGMPRIEMWPESHLERLLAAHPALIAEFQLHRTGTR